MSDLHIEVQEMLAEGHGVEWIVHELNVPWTAVEEIRSEMNDEINNEENFSESLYVF
jgi:hypothetical protein